MTDIAIRVENLSKQYPSTGPWSFGTVPYIQYGAQGQRAQGKLQRHVRAPGPVE